ncbi:MAG: lipooligosaccharide transport system permease protein [Pseudonocardiales bacterium]|jgi:lipooligosaccharide transport system permease protein|nr:lipooligosaccharide transport system permease protein [Pseudonocardiales bacterium]
MRTVTAHGVASIVTRNLMVYRHTWALLLAEILEPVLYLGSVGLGIGELVGHVPGLGSPNVRYAEFVAPALLATAAMNGSMNETTFLMYGRLAIERIYQPILATPVGIAEIALGEAAWAVLRGTVVTTAFLAVIASLGLVHSPWVLLAVPGAALIGFAFSAAGVVVVTYLRGFADMQYIQLVMLPMFLFATTFYPLGVYPRPVQVVVECLPLYQCIELLRRPALGEVDAQLLVPVLYLLAMGAVSLAWAVRRMQRVLVQ